MDAEKQKTDCHAEHQLKASIFSAAEMKVKFFLCTRINYTEIVTLQQLLVHGFCYRVEKIHIKIRTLKFFLQFSFMTLIILSKNQIENVPLIQSNSD